MTFTRVVLSASLLLLATATSSKGFVAISTADGFGADTFIRNGSGNLPIENNGFAPTVIVQNAEGSIVSLAMLRFDISTLPSTIGTYEAYLSLTRTAGIPIPRDWQVYGMTDQNPEEFWDEQTINFVNAPGISPQFSMGDGTFSLDLYDPSSNPSGTWEYLGTQSNWSPVNGIPRVMPNLDLGDFINADTSGTVTFLVVTVGPNAAPLNILASKEAGNPLHAPTLLVQPVPEPSIPTLAGLGIICLTRRRR